MRTILPFIVFMALLAPQVRDAPRDVSGTAAITGTVAVDETNGQPLRRALISVVVAGGTRSIQQTTTDDKGSFSIGGLPEGNATLTVSKPGYVTITYGAKQPGSNVGLPIALANGATADVAVRLPRSAVIAGTVIDENGAPMPSVGVRLQRVTTSALGQRLLTPVAGASIPSTDDRGAYRIFGLAAGDYVVMAQPRQMAPGEVRPATAAEFRWAEGQIAGASAGNPARQDSAPPVAQAITYAAVYYPGTVSAANAGIVTLAPGQERGGINLQLQFISTARIEGAVTEATGEPARGVQVILIPESDVGNDAQRLLVLMEVGMLTSTLATTGVDGSFSLQGVEPGAYTVLARRMPPAGRGGISQASVAAVTAWASADVRVDGRDITGLAMRLAPGQNVAGRIVLESKTPPATPPRVLVSLFAATSRGIGVTAPAVDVTPPGGDFAVEGLIPATYRIGVAAANWTLKSAEMNGRNIADTPFEIKPGEDIARVVLTLTDSAAEVTGVLYDAANRPTSDLSIVLFSTDRTTWFPGSRRVRPAVRAASNGRFIFSGLAAGEYYLAALTDVSANDLNSPQFLEQVAAAAIKIVVVDGEKKSQDLRIAR